MPSPLIKLVMIYITTPSKQLAQTISSILLKQKLIACCNIVDHVTSQYLWEGKLQKSNEVMMILKSRQELLEKIQKVVQDNHSYDVPEIIAVPIVWGTQKYTDWVIQSTNHLQEQIPINESKDIL